MSEEKFDLSDSKLLEAGQAVARLSRPRVPSDLASRTLARIAQSKPLRKTMLVLRPITNPLARVAAAAGIMLALFPMTDMDVAESLGSHIESRVVGPKVVDRVENLVDGLLLRVNYQGYSQTELDAVINVRSVNNPANKAKIAKPHIQPHV
jgi:hypothetical protein